MKIYTFPFALTIESELTVEEIELLQKKDPKALALVEQTETGELAEYFRLAYQPTEYGKLNKNSIIFVGETNNKKAGMSLCIPATLKGDEIGKYINEKISQSCKYIEIIEKEAKKALVVVEKTEKEFIDSIIPFELKENKTIKKEAKK